jgi:hypothetical protein
VAEVEEVAAAAVVAAARVAAAAAGCIVAAAVAAVDIQWPAVTAAALGAEWVAAPEWVDPGSQKAVIGVDS